MNWEFMARLLIDRRQVWVLTPVLKTTIPLRLTQLKTGMGAAAQHLCHEEFQI